VQAKFFDEPETDVQVRAVPIFYDRYPVMSVLKQMGLINEKLTATQKPWRPSFVGPTFLSWRFKVDPYLTDKGKDFVNRERGSSGGEGLPLYRRQIVQITGITKSADGKAEVQYSWKAIPTELGQTFDANGSFLKSLPAKQQEKLRRPVGLFGVNGSVVRNYDDAFQGKVNFQLFDDGWRVVSLH
jgi:hypothetical protein